MNWKLRRYISEKAMAPHSSTRAWKIPWAEEPSRLQSMGSLRVGHDWATSLSLFTFMHWKRKWQSTPVFLPGESQERRSLVGCHLWGRTESDTTEATYQQQQHIYMYIHTHNSCQAAANTRHCSLRNLLGKYKSLHLIAWLNKQAPNGVYFWIQGHKICQWLSVKE